jgi:hypothetical protein
MQLMHRSFYTVIIEIVLDTRLRLSSGSVDGWWAYKYYGPNVPMDHRSWPHRKSLLRSIILGDMTLTMLDLFL